MTYTVVDRMHVTAAWLNTLPLPEPMVVVDPALSPSVHWVVGPDDALQIIAAIGGEWDTYVGHMESGEVRTTTTRHVDHLGTDISVTVNVPGVNLPELAAEAVAS
jgi:hypothetical protein